MDVVILSYASSKGVEPVACELQSDGTVDGCDSIFGRVNAVEYQVIALAVCFPLGHRGDNPHYCYCNECEDKST